MCKTNLEFSNFLKESLAQQQTIAKKQLILNPVENIPELKYIELGYEFLYGIYNSDKLRSKESAIKTKIQFANRTTVAQDINLIYEAWCNLLKGDTISMRFFSGLHAHTTIFMAITQIGDNVIILPEEAGGHMATKTILERLGLNVFELIIDYDNMRIDIEASKELISQVSPVVIFIDRSEGLIYEDFSWLSEFNEIYKIYDASQYLTNVLVGDYISPFDMGFDAILSTTHKNFPGPQRALYCSKKKDSMWERIYSKIGTYVSNMHPYAIYSLGLMVENISKYQLLSKEMLKNTKLLGDELLKLGVNIINQPSMTPLEKHTHHLWILCNDKMSAFDLYTKWEKYGFLTNYRLLPYNLGYGIRIGLSAATVSGLTISHIPYLAQLLVESSESYDYNYKLHQEIEMFILGIKEHTHL